MIEKNSRRFEIRNALLGTFLPDPRDLDRAGASAARGTRAGRDILLRVRVLIVGDRSTRRKTSAQHVYPRRRALIAR